MDHSAAQRVSGLVPAAGRSGRVCIILDRGRGPTVSEARCVALGIRVGTLWTPELVAGVERAIRLDAAKDRALRRLKSRPRSRADLAAYLAQHEDDPEVLREVLEELGRAGLVDDAQFAQALIESQAARGPGRMYLAEQQLVESGVSAEVISGALNTQQSDPLEEAMLLIEQRRARAPRDEPATKTAARLLRLLGSRGFEEHIAREAIERAFGPDIENGDDHP